MGHRAKPSALLSLSSTFLTVFKSRFVPWPSLPDILSFGSPLYQKGSALRFQIPQCRAIIRYDSLVAVKGQTSSTPPIAQLTGVRRNLKEYGLLATQYALRVSTPPQEAFPTPRYAASRCSTVYGRGVSSQVWFASIRSCSV